MIVKLAEGTLKTKFGEFKEVLYYDGQKESIAFMMGEIENEEDVLCRVHSSCIFGHYFNSIECDCQEQMDISQELIQKAGKGIIILLEQEGKGNGHFALLNSVKHKREGVKQADAYQAVGFEADARNFNSAAKILKDLNVKSIRMLTGNVNKIKTLTQFGIEVSGIQDVIL
ncbi:GTP cyclohydrolase [Bernardetia sp. ABR2-2B]|uniref:GTP cyclohydrolase n=1 Tax=Bernardetia sp. ABR2-2B TaxID=3127472 RepID=UPI0030CE75A0